MEAIARIKMIRISPRKARLVAATIRRKPVASALSILEHTNKKASELFIELVKSAIANAVNNHGADAQKLVISDVTVNAGPTLKRFQPRSQGRAYSIMKRTSIMSVTVSDQPISADVEKSKTTKANKKVVKTAKVVEKKPVKAAKVKETPVKEKTSKKVEIDKTKDKEGKE